MVRFYRGVALIPFLDDVGLAATTASHKLAAIAPTLLRRWYRFCRSVADEIWLFVPVKFRCAPARLFRRASTDEI